MTTTTTFICPPGCKLQQRPHNQFASVQAILDIWATPSMKGALLCDPVGCGKTIEAIVAVNTLFHPKKMPRVLVLGSRDWLTSTWLKELKKWSLWNSITRVRATNKFTNEFVGALEGWVLMNHELLTRYEKALRARPWDILIVDEAHALKNLKAKRTINVIGSVHEKFKVAKMVKPTGDVISKIPARHLLFITGTPVLNQPLELYPLLHACDPKTWPTKKSWLKRCYSGSWYITSDNKVIGNLRKLETLKTVNKDLRSRLLIRGARVMPKVKPEIKRIDCPENNFAWFYDSFEKIRKINGQLLKLEEDLLNGKLLDELELLDVKYKRTILYATNESRSGGLKYQEVLAYLLTLDPHIKTLVFCRHKHDFALPLVDDLVKAGRKAAALTGNTKDMPGLIEQFQTPGNDLQFICGIFEKCSESITLTAADHLVLAEGRWTPATEEQACHRAWRHGWKEYRHGWTDYPDRTRHSKLTAVKFVLDLPESSDMMKSDRLIAKEDMISALIEG